MASLYEVPRVVKFIETDGKRRLSGMGSCLTGTEFQFGKMKKIWRWMVAMVGITM